MGRGTPRSTRDLCARDWSTQGLVRRAAAGVSTVTSGPHTLARAERLSGSAGRPSGPCAVGLSRGSAAGCALQGAPAVANSVIARRRRALAGAVIRWRSRPQVAIPASTHVGSRPGSRTSLRAHVRAHVREHSGGGSEALVGVDGHKAQTTRRLTIGGTSQRRPGQIEGGEPAAAAGSCVGPASGASRGGAGCS